MLALNCYSSIDESSRCSYSSLLSSLGYYLRFARPTRFLSSSFQIMPLHCAAINPNVKYLQKLFAVVPDYQVKDNKGRKLIHYAAACEGAGPLKFLLSRYFKVYGIYDS